MMRPRSSTSICEPGPISAPEPSADRQDRKCQVASGERAYVPDGRRLEGPKRSIAVRPVAASAGGRTPAEPFPQTFT